MNEPGNGRDEAFEARTRALFDGSLDGLDARTRSRLTQARHVALAELDRPPWFRWRVWAPAGAAAALAIVAVTLWVGPARQHAGEPTPAASLPAATFDDFDLVAGADDLDLFDEEPEFYAWASAPGDMG